MTRHHGPLSLTKSLQEQAPKNQNYSSVSGSSITNVRKEKTAVRAMAIHRTTAASTAGVGRTPPPSCDENCTKTRTTTEINSTGETNTYFPHRASTPPSQGAQGAVDTFRKSFITTSSGQKRVQIPPRQLTPDTDTDTPHQQKQQQQTPAQESKENKGDAKDIKMSPLDEMYVYVTGKQTSERSRCDRAIKFPLKVR